MKKLKHYLIFWFAVASLFNVFCFITPVEWYGTNKYSGAFWAGYAFIMVAFILHLIYAVFVFREKNLEKKALNNPITVISFIELGVMLVAGTVCMIVSGLPYWAGILLCYAILAFSIVFLVSVKAVEKNKYEANKQLNRNSAFIRESSDAASYIVSSSKTEAIRKIATKVYEAIRYSDPISSDETRADELEISNSLKDLSEMVKNCSDEESFNKKADEIILLIERRNNKCKTFKRRT